MNDWSRRSRFKGLEDDFSAAIREFKEGWTAAAPRNGGRHHASAMTAPDTLVRTAIEAVTRACRVARSVQSHLADLQQITKDDRSPVTVADFAVQAIVCLELTKALGPVPIVGEETAEVLRDPTARTVRDAVVQAVQSTATQRRLRPDPRCNRCVRT